MVAIIFSAILSGALASPNSVNDLVVGQLVAHYQRFSYKAELIQVC